MNSQMILSEETCSVSLSPSWLLKNNAIQTLVGRTKGILFRIIAMCVKIITIEERDWAQFRIQQKQLEMDSQSTEGKVQGMENVSQSTERKGQWMENVSQSRERGSVNGKIHKGDGRVGELLPNSFNRILTEGKSRTDKWNVRVEETDETLRMIQYQGLGFCLNWLMKLLGKKLNYVDQARMGSMSRHSQDESWE